MCTSCVTSSRADLLISFLRDVAMLSLAYSAFVHEAAAVVVAGGGGDAGVALVLPSPHPGLYCRCIFDGAGLQHVFDANILYGVVQFRRCALYRNLLARVAWLNWRPA